MHFGLLISFTESLTPLCLLVTDDRIHSRVIGRAYYRSLRSGALPEVPCWTASMRIIGLAAILSERLRYPSTRTQPILKSSNTYTNNIHQRLLISNHRVSFANQHDIRRDLCSICPNSSVWPTSSSERTPRLACRPFLENRLLWNRYIHRSQRFHLSY